MSVHGWRRRWSQGDEATLAQTGVSLYLNPVILTVFHKVALKQTRVQFELVDMWDDHGACVSVSIAK
jgi:hypothetical protein